MNAQIFSDLIEKYADLQELNARILNKLIERIVIHEKEIINGEKFQTVEIYYKFVGGDITADIENTATLLYNRVAVIKVFGEEYGY